jgi:ribonuclease D
MLQTALVCILSAQQDQSLGAAFGGVPFNPLSAANRFSFAGSAANSESTMTTSKPILHRGDLPSGVSFLNGIAIDTETLGLNPHRDRLCLVQLSGGDGTAHLVKFDGNDYNAPNLNALLVDPSIVKIFHFARFDIAVLKQYLGVETTPLYCTKIASKLARTYTDRHGLKDLVGELLGIEISKQQQSSDWGAAELSESQMSYAANDVLHLHALKAKLDAMLAREGRTEFAKQAFGFLPTRARLDLAGFEDDDIFAH